MRCGLEWYSEFIPDKEDCQDECVAAVGDHGKYVTVLVGQCNNGSSRQYQKNRIWSQLTSQPFNLYVRHTLYCPRGLRLRCFVDCVCLLAINPRRTVLDN